MRTIADWQKLDEEALKRFRLLPNFAKEQLRTLPQEAEKTDFVSLALVSTLVNDLFTVSCTRIFFFSFEINTHIYLNFLHFFAIYLNHIPCTKCDINFNSQAKDTLDRESDPLIYAQK